MHDLATLRDNPEHAKKMFAMRAPSFNFDDFMVLDARRREALSKAEAYKAKKNQANAAITELLKQKKDPKEAIAAMKSVAVELDQLDAQAADLDTQVRDTLMYVPNLPHSSVPAGTDASQNQQVKTWSQPKTFDFKVKDHIELAQSGDFFDQARGAKISGSGFIVYQGAGARLQRALINFMLDTHTQEHGYREYWPPYLVNKASMMGTGQLPKFEEDMYALKHDDLFLIPTAEVPVTNILRDETLNEDDLPVKFAAFSACFRREAGAYGKDTKGLVRVHQFDKVELVKFALPEHSYAEHEKMLADACRILELLELPYRIMLLCAGDMGFSAAKCYDIEVWAPGLQKWLECSSVSNFEAFQARRANIRVKRKSSGKSEYVHTLNGSGLALPRIVIAILENYQRQDGSVEIPKVLRPYFSSQETF